MQAKKSLGQNFLKAKGFLREIVRAADLKQGDLVLEVGPGKGSLTETLLQSKCRVIAVEKDDRLIEYLKEKFEEYIKSDQLKIIHNDILNFNPKSYGLEARKYSIVANIPYYITGIFLRKFLSADHHPSRMVVLVQKEVAKRIVARDKKESILSISVKAYGEPKYIKTLPARFFSPAPKVDSAILLIDNISRKFFHDNKINEEKFFELVKIGFSHKRKMLLGNLRQISPKIKDGISILEKFRLCQIPEKARAEDLNLEDWRCLILN